MLERFSKFGLLIITIFCLVGAASVTGSYMYFNNLHIGRGYAAGGATLDANGNADFAGTVTADDLVANTFTGAVVMDLDDITNVGITNPVNGQVLKYLNGLWYNGNLGAFDIDDLLDVVITEAANEDFLYYNGTNWVDGPILAAHLNWLNATSTTNGNIFIYNSNVATSTAVSGDISLSATGVTAYTGDLGNIPDVTLTSLAAGHLLYHNGTVWANKAFDWDLDDLTDTVISTPATASLLVYDGTNWIDVALSGDGTINSSGVLDIPVFDGDGDGLVPDPGLSGIDTFLCADGTFKTPSVGSISGPGTSTNLALAIWDGTDGNTIKNSSILSTVTNGLVIPGTLTLGTGSHIISNSLGLIDGGKIQGQTITSTQMSLSGVAAGTYDPAHITVDSAGRITYATTAVINLIDLGDGETAYTGDAGKVIVVNTAEDGWEFGAVVSEAALASAIPVASVSGEIAAGYIPDFTGDSGTGGVNGGVPAPAAGDTVAGKFLFADGTWAVPSGSGNVAGPSSSTDNAVTRFDGTTGQTIQNSGVIIDDSNNITIPGTLTVGSGSNLLVNSAGLIDGSKIQALTVDFGAFDIAGSTELTTVADADMIAIYDDSETTTKKISRANFLAGYTGDDMGSVDTEAEFEAALTDVTDVLTNNDANYAYMINSAGTSGQVWTSDGDGRGAWATATGGASAFTDLSDVPAAYTGQAGKVVAVNSGETALEFIAGGGGASAFTDLSDAPSAYTSQGGKYVRVNVGETGLEFATVSGGSAGPDTLCTLLPSTYFPPATAYATRDTRNNTPVLDFDATTDESAMWLDILPVRYAGGGITVEIVFAATSAISGDVVWCAQIERIGSEIQDLDADGFASAKTVTVTTSGTSGYTKKASLSFANGAEMDSVAAGEAFRVKIYRDADNAADTATGDAELIAVHVKETP